MIERIAKLLALAEGASTVEEAEAAFQKAQALASKHAIDLELARVKAAPKERERPIKKTIRVGERGKRSNASFVSLFLTIGSANDVQCLIAHNSTYVIAHGLPSDIEKAELLWASLAPVLVKFGDAHVRDPHAAWRSETSTVRVTVKNPGYYGSTTSYWEEKPVSGQGARRSFYEGFISRIGQRLREAKKEAIREAEEHFHGEDQPVAQIDGSTLPSSLALVLKSKKAEVAEFLDAEYIREYGHKPRGSWRGGSSNGTHSSSSHSAGRAAADRANLGGRRGIGS